VADLYFEDFKVGDRFPTRAVTLTEADIIAFARQWDPQPFHLDPEAARASIYGGLIASGMQTIALTLRLFLDTGAVAASSLGSPGCEVQWKSPVRPGDTLRVVVEVIETRPSSSKPDRGIVRLRYTTLNQRDEPVMTMIGNQLVRRRPR
jgi:acyl dehydratase